MKYLIAMLLIPSIACADSMQDLIKALQAGLEGESPFVEGNRYPFPLAPSKPVYEAPKVIQINPHPMLLREQVISERLGGVGSESNTPLNRALQGALFDAVHVSHG